MVQLAHRVDWGLLAKVSHWGGLWDERVSVRYRHGDYGVGLPGFCL